MEILNQLSSKQGDKTEIDKLVRPFLEARKKVVANEAKKIINQTEKQK